MTFIIIVCVVLLVTFIIWRLLTKGDRVAGQESNIKFWKVLIGVLIAVFVIASAFCDLVDLLSGNVGPYPEWYE